MANLKRNSIELLKEMKDEKAVTERYWTVPFPTLSMVYEASDILGNYEEKQQEAIKNKELFSSKQVKVQLELMADFLANRLYGGQFTKEELAERFYGPNAFDALQEQVLFVANGLESNDTKKFLAAKKN